MSQPEANALPVYFVADESLSMQQCRSQLNEGLSALLDAMHQETQAAAKIRFGVVGFSDDAQVRLPITDLRTIEAMPQIPIRTSTSYRAAFETLLSLIPADVQQLKDASIAVHRPAVFFLSDGHPNDNEPWEPAYAALTASDFSCRPNILAFGFGAAKTETIAEVATREEYAFMAAEGADTGRAIVNFMQALTRSIINSGNAVAGSQPELQVEKPDDFINISLDTI